MSEERAQFHFTLRTAFSKIYPAYCFFRNEPFQGEAFSCVLNA